MAGQGSGSGNSFVTASPDTVLSATYYGYLESGTRGNVIIQIMDYSATDKHKTALARANNTNNGTNANAGRWANNAAISTVRLGFQKGSQSLASGSRVSLYGVA
jgi:hypothetical protein